MLARSSLFLAVLLLSLAAPAAAKDEEPPWRSGGANRGGEVLVPEEPDVTKAQVEAIRRGLAFLAGRQDRDGSFNESKDCNIAVTSLSVLALMANGNTERRGRYRDAVRLGVRFLMNHVTLKDSPELKIPAGYICSPHDEYSRMHGHGYATTVLALAYGMGDLKRREELRPLLDLAIRCIEQSQSESGGWYYTPSEETLHEGSVTVCQIQALRSAREAGCRVSKSVIDLAVSYMERSQDRDSGGFAYSLSERSRQSYAITAAALSTLFGLGEYDRTEMIKKGLEYMSPRGRSLRSGHMSWFFYGNFYAAQAFWQAAADERFRHYWREWWPTIREYLVASQDEEGCWPYSGNSIVGVDRAYATAMATLILQVPLSVLPLFQR